jgi:hypothetical protein
MATELFSSPDQVRKNNFSFRDGTAVLVPLNR